MVQYRFKREIWPNVFLIMVFFRVTGGHIAGYYSLYADSAKPHSRWDGFQQYCSNLPSWLIETLFFHSRARASYACPSPSIPPVSIGKLRGEGGSPAGSK